MPYVKPGTDPNDLSTLVVDKPLFNVPVIEAAGGWAIIDPYTGYIEVLEASRLATQSVRDAMGSSYIPPVPPSSYTLAWPNYSNEGSNSILFISTTNVENGTPLFWNIVPISSSLDDFDVTSGSFTVFSNSSFTPIPITADFTTEGEETFVVEIRTDSENGTVVTSTNEIIINDTSLTRSYSISSPLLIDEGSTIQFDITTDNVPNSTMLYWEIVNTTTSNSDFDVTSGSFAVNANSASFVVQIVEDFTTEGNEEFSVEIKTGSQLGPVVAVRPVVINDTSLTKNYYVNSPVSVNEGSTVQFNVTTDNVSNGTELFWEVVHNATTNSDFTATSGSVTINNGAGVISVETIADVTTEGTEYFSVQLRTGSLVGPIVASSSAATAIIDTSVTPPLEPVFFPLSSATTADPVSTTFKNNPSNPTYTYVQDVGITFNTPPTSFAHIFSGKTTFNDPAVADWDTSYITSMASMFNGATVFNQDISTWNTEKVTNMTSMFFNAKAFNQNIGSWNTSNVTSMGFMFRDTNAFNQDISTWNTAKVISMSYMFYNAAAFDQPIGSWNTTSVTNMKGLFYNAAAYNKDVSAWNTSNVTDMANVFYDAVSFNQPLNSWNTTKVTDMYGAFGGALAFNQPLNNWNTASVTNMSLTFYKSAFNENISTWDVSKVVDMSGMFSSNSVFNQPINTWNTASLTSPVNMFYKALVFDQPLSNLNISKVTNLTNMFYDAKAFNQDISTWNTSNVTILTGVFYGASVFNQNVAPWNTINVTSFNNMFQGAVAFDQDISTWNTTNAVTMSNMFASATVFNQNIGTWDTANVTTMSSMFNFAKAFNQDISGWNTAKVTNMSSMFYATDNFNQNISLWSVTNVTSMNSTFAFSKAFNQDLGLMVTGLTVQPLSFSTNATLYTNPAWKPLLSDGVTRINT